MNYFRRVIDFLYFLEVGYRW